MKKSIFSNKIAVIGLSLFVSMLWGSLFPSIKLGYKAFDIDSSNVASILVFAGLRFFVSGIILIGLVSSKKSFQLPNKDQFKSVLIVSILTVVLHYAFTYIGLSLADGSKSSVLKQSAFLVLPCIAFLFRREDKFSIYKVTGGILGFLSVIIINLDGTNLYFGLGEILVIIASFCSMFGQVASKNIYDKYDSTYIVAYSQFSGGIILLAVGYILGGTIGTVSVTSICVLSYICFASILANVLWNKLISYNDMSRLAILKSVDPLFASAFSAILLHENIFRWEFILAVILVILAVAVSNINMKRK